MTEDEVDQWLLLHECNDLVSGRRVRSCPVERRFSGNAGLLALVSDGGDVDGSLPPHRRAWTTLDLGDEVWPISERLFSQHVRDRAVASGMREHRDGIVRLSCHPREEMRKWMLAEKAMKAASFLLQKA